jgi:hypothetical protein
MRTLIILSIITLIVSCQRNDSSKDGSISSVDTFMKTDSSVLNNNLPKVQEINDSILSTSNLNTFKTLFIDKFSTDSLFQIKFTVFPFIEKGYERNVETTEDIYFEKKYSSKKWIHLDLRYDSSKFYKENDRITQNFEMIGRDTIKIKYSGMDNGVFFGYIFAKDSVWKLVETWDYSN